MSSSSKSGSKPTGTHVNPDPTPEVAAIPTDKAARQRGPVEEVIFKRMKQLGKKLQRYRAYAAQDVNTLNADQRAALVALPALEGAYKELEDLVRDKGPVEEQELIQSAKLREATDAARAAALAEAGSSTEQYKTSLAKPLSLFLRLYGLLHPARASDHEHLTFAPLDLPDNLTDEVQATDVIRVGRLYEDLLSGGEAAQVVLDLLVSGANGEDEENDRVHHLLDILAQPTPTPAQSVESATETPAEPAADADFSGAALAESVEAATEAAPEAVVSQEDGPSSGANSHASAHQPTKTTINFLQEDELEVPAAAEAEQAKATEPVDDLKDDPIEQSYEIVPSLEAHQTSGQQPPVEEASASRPSAASRAPSNFAPAPTGSWADLDDEEDFLGAAQAAATQFASAITETATAASTETTEQLVASTSAADSAAAAEGSSSRDKSSPKVARGKGRGRGGQNRPRQGGRQPSQSQGQDQDGQQQERAPRQQRPPRQPREPKQPSQDQSQAAPGAKVVDDDGFEVKVRRGPQQPTRGTGGTRGLTRGAPRGAAANGGRGGSGGRGGRGGANGTGQRTGSGQQEQRKPSQSQGQSGPKANGAAAAPAAPKPSIFKAVQPTGPKSAPIIS